MIDRLYRFVDTRLRVARFTEHSLNKVFPDNFTFMFGELAMYAFVVLLVTGVYLTAFLHPSGREVVYHGHYEALDGADALAIVTEWNEYRTPDFGYLKHKLKQPVIFDGRNLYDPAKMAREGFTYNGIGLSSKPQ